MPISSTEFVTSTLLQYKRKHPSFEYAILLSDDKTSFSTKFVTACTPLLEKKKDLAATKMIYIAMRPVGDDKHWTSAVLMLKRHKPRLFILDSIANFSKLALAEMAKCMAKYGGHTYLCCSGVQLDYTNCSKFTLDFLIEMYKLNSIFSFLVMARQKHKPVDGVTTVEYTDLPWQLIRNSQDITKITTYIKLKPSSEALDQYLKAHTEERTIKGKKKETNTGIETVSFAPE